MKIYKLKFMKYLYGASVQGIQDFIFETNKLTEIVGASEIVEHICTSFFKECVEAFQIENLLIGAAGNIKYLFGDIASCEKLVYDFPKKVLKIAPGITISQAVVKVNGEVSNSHIQALELRLKTQRNCPPVHHGLGLMISERSRRTGKPGVQWDDGDAIDASQVQKREFAGAAQNSLINKIMPNEPVYFRSFPVEMDDIAEEKQKNPKNWIAVIHADGNDLGKNIIEMANNHSATQNHFRELSTRLEKATTLAVQEAFDRVVRANVNGNGLFPFRPIVLGGDDLTVLVRGDLAIDFTHHFLRAFEEKTKEQFANFEGASFRNGLTACAGIAFIKPKYPFHYGVHLAEELCKYAKKVAKGLNFSQTPSCLQFHIVHSSFTDNYADVIRQELFTKTNIHLNFGPYFLNRQNSYATIEALINWIKLLNEKSSPKARLRNWLTALQENNDAAMQDLRRIIQITDDRYVRNLDLEYGAIKDRSGKKYTHLFDAISLSAIKNL